MSREKSNADRFCELAEQIVNATPVKATSLPDLGDQVAEAYRESMGFGLADADCFNEFAATLDTLETSVRRLALDHAGKVILTDLVQGVKRGLETLRRECHA